MCEKCMICRPDKYSVVGATGERTFNMTQLEQWWYVNRNRKISGKVIGRMSLILSDLI